jgi:D-alanyl-D-alanine carboxypeptidase
VANGDGITNATTRPAARIAGPALMMMLLTLAVAVPAQGAANANATAGAASSAGATWSQLMRRKLNLEADSVRLTALLPDLRTTAIIRRSNLIQAQRTQRAAVATVTNAAAVDQNARSRYAAARTAAAAVKKAVTAAQKRRPHSNSRIARATRALTAAKAAVLARATSAGRTASASKAARNAYTSATNQVTTATTACLTATRAVSDTEQTIRSLPQLDSALAARTAAISELTVTQTRASFTIAQTTQVYGVTVNTIVAFPFQRMIDDAAKAGIKLSGGGFRTKQQQIALRTTNGCPDVWTAPASSCKVPTAIPGRSLHELGLAVDLTSGKKTINDRKSAAFIWLVANAGRYGLVNLPSEPWHWSITGH